ncbi:MAG TPA: PxKF domain-containing protein [bacterium]|nr:PxKF domain-containing protein [bacterium]
MLRHGKLGVLVALLLSISTAVVAAAPFAYITNSGSANILVIDTATETGVTPISLPAGTVPYGVAVSPDGSRVYVSHFAFQGKLFVVDTASNTVLASPAVGMFPFGVAVHPSGNRVFVTTMQNGGRLVAIDATTFSVTPVFVGNPRGIAVHPDGSKIYVVNYFNDSVSIMDAATLSSIGSIDVGVSPIGIAVSADGSRIYVTNEDSGTVSVINSATNAVVATVTVGNNPVGVTVTPDGARVYVANSLSGTVSVIDAGTNMRIGDVHVGNHPYGISNDGAQVYVALVHDSKVVVINRATNAILKEFPANVPVAFGQFIRPASRIDSSMALHLEPAEVIVGSSSTVVQRATLTRRDSGAGIDGATITFSVDGATLGSAVTASGGVATWNFNPSGLEPGPHAVRAAFAESVIGGLTYGAANASASLRVQYHWLGWMPPVVGEGALNQAKAGSNVPVKWQIKDASGNLINALSAVVGIQTALIPCAGDGASEFMAASSPGNAGLRYDGRQFHFNWKTEQSWMGQCRAIMVELADGTTHMAKFQFR